MNAKIIFYYVQHFKFPNRNTGIKFKVIVCQCKNVIFPISNFEGTFITYVFGKSFFHYRELKSECWTSRLIICEKNIKFFVCAEFRILVNKWNMYEAHIFPRPLQQTCRLETTYLRLNTRVRENKKFKFSHYFYWN